MTEQNHQPTTFETFVKSHAFGQRDRFRDALLRRFNPRISDQTYRNWERGVYEPDEARRDIINEVAVEIYGETIY